MQIQKVYQYWRLMESKIQKRRIRTNIKKKKKKKKNVIMAIHSYVIMITLVSLLGHTQTKIQFTILLTVGSKRLQIIAK